MRLFIAVDLPETLKTRIQELIENLSRAMARDAKIKWVRLSQFHITLRFLGECEEAWASQLRDALNRIVTQNKSFPITLEGLGCFPDHGMPRALYVGVSEGKDALKALAEQIEVGLGIQNNRSFHAHLTLGRVKNAANGNRIRSRLQEHPFPSLGTFTVETITLYKSILSPRGPTYDPLHTVYFSKR